MADDRQRPPPSTIAVALGTRGQEGAVPRVMATGRGQLAEQILELAFAHGVSVRQDSDLAEVLTALELDAPIPVEAFSAIAEILVFVYRANAAYSQRHPTTPTLPEPDHGGE